MYTSQVSQVPANTQVYYNNDNGQLNMYNTGLYNNYGVNYSNDISQGIPVMQSQVIPSIDLTNSMTVVPEVIPMVKTKPEITTSHAKEVEDENEEPNTQGGIQGEEALKEANKYIKKLEEISKCKDEEKFDPNGWKKFYPGNDMFFKYDYGATYQDQVIIKNPEELKKCEVYKGELNAKGQRHGFGVLYNADGIKRGDFRNGRFTGWGRNTKKSGEIFEGKFINGALDGKGIYTNQKGNKYVGDFVKGEKTGRGEFTTKKFHYVGDMREGKLNGKGRIDFLKEGHVYEGDFIDNELTGEGVFEWNNGDVYEGHLTNGRMDGKGKYIHSNGQIYEGDYVDGVKSGHGILTYPKDGKTYEGGFAMGLPHGKGIFTKNGISTEVNFDMGKVIEEE